jgi:hypothetical protein
VVSQDVHHGNGTEEIAQDFPNLFFASVSATALLGCGWQPLLRSVSLSALVSCCRPFNDTHQSKQAAHGP